MNPLRKWRVIGVMILGGIVAACTSFPPPPVVKEPEKQLSCTPALTGEPLVGNWISKRQQKGVAGELRTLFTLQSDGRMLYTEQIKRPRQPSQGLSESGCWWRDGDQLVLKTLESNGLPVDVDDPIYENRYTVTHSSADQLRLSGSDGVQHSTTRTSPGYRLPF